MQSELSNIYLRHAVLATLHNHIQNFTRCMDKELFGKNQPEEINLVNQLIKVNKEIGQMMIHYYEQESRLTD
jgi:hypothetical protein